MEKGSRSVFYEDDLYDYYYGLADLCEVVNDGWYAYCSVDEESVSSEEYGHEVRLETSPLYHYSR